MKYPSSARRPVDWDKVTTSSDEEDSDGKKPQGEDALRRLFQQVYDRGSDETRRAMIKSLQESGGTRLSTNWSQVSSENMSPSPPEGCEAKRL